MKNPFIGLLLHKINNKVRYLNSWFCGSSTTVQEVEVMNEFKYALNRYRKASAPTLREQYLFR